MPGLGTIINTALIIAGGIVGFFLKKGIRESMRNTLVYILGVTVLFVGIGGAVEAMFSVSDGKLSGGGTLMMVVSLALGAIIGELLRIEAGIERFGAWLKRISKSEDDNGFVQTFLNASCTVCIGAMAIIGSINDALFQQYDILILKGILDCIIVCMMTAANGKGAIFSAIPVALFQGICTVLALCIGDFLPQQALNNLSLVGSILIFCVGLNLIREKKISVANCLPAVIIACAWGFFS